MISEMQNYFPAAQPHTSRLLAADVRAWWAAASGENQHLKELVFFCIGTTRVTGDSFGPLAGEMLAGRAATLAKRSIYVAGTLRQPIHAENLAERYAIARREHPRALIVAVDAGLGSPAQVGCLTMWRGSMSPGLALNKDLPSVGDLSIAGIVGVSGPESFQTLQNTPPRMVKKMADRIFHAICQL